MKKVTNIGMLTFPIDIDEGRVALISVLDTETRKLEHIYVIENTFEFFAHLGTKLDSEQIADLNQLFQQYCETDEGNDHSDLETPEFLLISTAFFENLSHDKIDNAI